MSGRIGLVALLLVLVGLFGVSVLGRRDRFGDLQGRGHEWLTGSATKFTRNWYREGAWRLRFAMLEDPASIEFPTIASRDPYVSYPPGCLIPVYALSRLTREEPSPRLVMMVNLGGQLLSALALFAILFLALDELGLGSLARAAFGALAFLLSVFLPGPSYWLQNVYFSDQAILPWVLLAILLEQLHERSGSPSWEWIQSGVVGWGVFTDWFMIPVAAMLLVKKWRTTWSSPSRSSRLRHTVVFLAPSMLALALFVLQVASLDGFTNLQRKLLNRTGLTPGTSFHFSQLHDRFWKVYLPHNFGSEAAPWLLLLSACVVLALALTRPRGGVRDPGESRALWLAALLLIPPTVHGLVFWQHSVDHSFSPLRFLPAFACLPFALAPFATLRRFGVSGRARNAFGVALLAAGLLYPEAYGGLSLGAERARHPEIPALGASLARLTGHDDVVFSPDFEVPANPPELLSYSMKRVYRVALADSLAARVRALPDRARVRLAFVRDPDPAWAALVSGLTPRDDGMVRAYDLGRADSLRARAQRTRTSERVTAAPPATARTK